MNASNTNFPIRDLLATVSPDQASEEIEFKQDRYVKSGVKSSNSFFGFFKAFFRTSAECEKNKRTIQQAREEIKGIFGSDSDAIKKFDAAFQSKISSGSPLTKGALWRFKESLSDTDKKKLKTIEELKEQQKLGESLTEEQQIRLDAAYCLDMYLRVNNKTEEGLWKKAADSYEYAHQLFISGDKNQARINSQVAQGYARAASAYSSGKKDLAHYLEQHTEFYKAEQLALRDQNKGYKEEAQRYRFFNTYYSKAISAEEEGKLDVAQYWSKAAKCFDAAQRAARNRQLDNALELKKAGDIYKNTAETGDKSNIETADAIIEEYHHSGKSHFEEFDFYFETNKPDATTTA